MYCTVGRAHLQHVLLFSYFDLIDSSIFSAIGHPREAQAWPFDRRTVATTQGEQKEDGRKRTLVGGNRRTRTSGVN